jgi:hypothetical protein
MCNDTGHNCAPAASVNKTTIVLYTPMGRPDVMPVALWLVALAAAAH